MAGEGSLQWSDWQQAAGRTYLFLIWLQSVLPHSVKAGFFNPIHQICWTPPSTSSNQMSLSKSFPVWSKHDIVLWQPPQPEVNSIKHLENLLPISRGGAEYVLETKHLTRAERGSKSFSMWSNMQKSSSTIIRSFVVNRKDDDDFALFTLYKPEAFINVSNQTYKGPVEASV